MDLDEKLLGQRLPGTPKDRAHFLRNLQELINRNGEQWVRDGKGRLIEEAEWIIINQPIKKHLDVSMTD